VYLDHNQKQIPELSTKTKEKLKDSLLISLSEKLSASLDIASISIADPSDIRKNAPSLNVAISTAVDSMWNSITERYREPKASDFADIVHSLYAPYVDVFRADAYMAPLIASTATHYGTKVVGRLKDIPTAIEEKIKTIME
jgi:hypothetical protein